MAFQIKNFASIVASMINRMRATQTKITDFNIGAVGRTLVEAPATEIDQLYQQMFNGLREAIPVSVFTSFNFSPIPASGATGIIQVTITSSPTSTLIPAGTKFSSSISQTVYVANSDTTVPAGNTVANVQVAANTTGTATNIVEGVSFTLTPSPAGFISAINPGSFSNGVNAETPAEQLVRFNSFIASLPRGTTASLYYALQNLVNVQDANGNIIERVVYSSVVEPYLADNTQPVSLVNCYIHNGVGSTSSALLAQAQKVLFGYYTPQGVPVPGYQAAGINVVTYIAQEVPLNVTGLIAPLAGYSVTDQIINGTTVQGLATLAAATIYSYIQTLPIGATALWAEISALVMAIPGVYNFAYVTPQPDVTSTAVQKLMPGTITLTQGAAI